ncbi:sphingosine-1-phosphate phosphohydrolase, putative [Entamoeba invadens IP1]|uniref:sphingosine-1-phosphate phosphohydrolase, putative n=1 Tax=Entamoeba invadens IP1 TaxID=370355 RepID=UPI0002C3DB89|nr:sphingosine-1-phosphate phosphohydrolase, putative [Entamoeba invadens IP1]ELP85340.1 sphingosine-1-phosphate phosphohydrolase, putative [Entamoeba invadens IP1]|eukprot:XP_004184686.1 sphingosine-1-phosphate phosphohydrolase, putative [Entamoeba invadens IP1]
MIVICQELRKTIEKFVHDTIPFILDLQKKRNIFSDIFFLFITFIAGTGIYAVVLPTTILFYPHPDFAIACIAITFTSCYNILVGNFIKNLFGLPRPFGEGLWSPVKEKDFGFPSTHTINAIANTGFVVFALTDDTWLRVIYLVYAVCVAFSRMYMGVHSPADVLCGVTIGITHLIIMVNLYQYIIYIHSLWYLLPLFFFLHLYVLIAMPKCKEYNVTPRRTAMICGCIFAISIVLSFNLQRWSRNILPLNEYVKYQYNRFSSFIIEYLVAISICAGLFGTFGFLLPNIVERYIEKNKRYMNFLTKCEQLFCKIRFHCLKDDINEYRCDKTMLRYIAEMPFAYFSGFIGGLCVIYIAPKVVFWMNPNIILN